MSEIKLLPCPFCGGEATPLYCENGNRYTSNILYLSKRGTIKCKKCELTLPRVYSKVSKAVEVWNTRKPIEQIVERLEEKTKKAKNNSEKAAELGEAYEKHMIFNGAKETAFEEAIEIIKEEGGI